MRFGDFSRYALSSCVIVLSACSSGVPNATPQVTLQSFDRELGTNASSKSFRILYQFRGGRDGEGPAGPLIDVNGSLYGVTSAGGGHPQCLYGDGCGDRLLFDPERVRKCGASLCRRRGWRGSILWFTRCRRNSIRNDPLWRRVWLRRKLWLRHDLHRSARRQGKGCVLIWELPQWNSTVCRFDRR